MSYVPPPGDAADFSWLGESAYTPPAGDSADFSFAPASQQVTGFYPVVFGTASALVPENLECQVIGFLAAAHGAPHLALLLEVANPTAAPVFGVTVAFGVLQSGEADGFSPTAFGGGYAFISPTIKYSLVVRATGFKPVQSGTPSSPFSQSVQARSLPTSRFGAHRTGVVPVSKFGAHRYACGARAAPTQSTVFGSPAFAGKHEAGATGPAVFGQARGTAGHVAASTRRTKYGQPTALQSGHRAYGFTLHGRMGWPTCIIGRPSAQVAGFSPTVFGDSTAIFAYRALHIPPEHKFGAPLMKRIV